ncbi:MAG: AI-2E family transporter [Planctomycetota bacterium]
MTDPAQNTKTNWSATIRKLMIWAVFGGALYLLRSFFLLILLTFVIGYCAEQVVHFLSLRFRKASRQALVCIVFTIGIGALVGLGFIMVPAVESEVEHVKLKFPEYRDQIVSKYKEFQQSYPSAAQGVENALRELDTFRKGFLTTAPESQAATRPSASENAGGIGERDIAVAADVVLKSVSSLVSAVFTVLLAVLFAFLILIDLANIREETERLRSSRIGWLYEEVRTTVVEFSASVGWILEAQIVISTINVILTIAGLWILGVPSLVLLTVILFFCGLVPVLGALVPLLPIALIAFAEGGLSLLIKCLIFIAVERIFVGYVVEPRIFGKRFHMNSVFILVILLIGYQLAGLWGVILGLPVAHSALRQRHGPALEIPPGAVSLDSKL